MAKDKTIIARIEELKRGGVEVNNGVKNKPVASDPMDYLVAIMTDPNQDPRIRLDAAKTLMPYIHGKVGDIGKKEVQKELADIKTKAGGLSARLAERSNLKRVK